MHNIDGTAPLTTVGGRWHVTKVILRYLGLCLSCWGSAVRTRLCFLGEALRLLKCHVLVLWCFAAAHLAAPDEL
eukprot:scaffold9253_cov109-Phaeocystis_antarctica.AAC.1